MKTNIFLLTLGLTLSLNTLEAHGMDRNIHISPRDFNSTGVFKPTKKGEPLSGPICECEPQLVMTSCFLKKTGALESLTIHQDLSMYANKFALLRAVASCIHADQAAGNLKKHPDLSEWERMSPRCNPEFATEEDFSAWLRTLAVNDKIIVNKLEAFMQNIINHNFAAKTYCFGTDRTTRARRPATA